MSIIEAILVVAEKLFGLRGQLSEARHERKQTVADFLSAIATTLERTSVLLKQRRTPHAQCQELLAHSQNMKAAIGDLVGEQLAQELGAQLAEAHHVRQLQVELFSVGSEEQHARLSILDQAAGQFRATAAFVRVSP